jgi:CspA family cold shock protein
MKRTVMDSLAAARPDKTATFFLMIASPRGDRTCVRTQPDAQEQSYMAIGTVKFFNANKGFGFISPEGGAKDVFVHATAVEAAGMRTLSEGQKVSFDIQPDARGSKAVNLRNA